MRLVARLLIGLFNIVALMVLAPIGLITVLVLGISDLGKWAELHGQFDSDKAAQERARWRNS